MPLRSLILALFVIIIWGLNFAVIKIGVEAMPPIALLAARYGLAGLILLPFLKWPGRTQAFWCVMQGVFLGVLHQGTLFYGMTIMPAGLMSIILQSGVLLVTLMGWLIFKEQIGWRTWLGIAIGLCGVIILIGLPSEGTSIIGYIIALISTFFASFTYIIMKKIGTVHAPTYIVLLSLPVAPVIIGMSILFEGTDWIIKEYTTLNWPVIGAVVFYEAVILSLSHMIWQWLVVREPIGKMMSLVLLVPVFGVIGAIVFLSEPLTLPMIIGGIVTLLGVGIVTIRKAQKSQDPLPILGTER